ncbi:MAG: hypothetical protein WCH04_11545 [Gammaproteobacteria bacterium]
MPLPTLVTHVCDGSGEPRQEKREAGLPGIRHRLAEPRVLISVNGLDHQPVDPQHPRETLPCGKRSG